MLSLESVYQRLIDEPELLQFLGELDSVKMIRAGIIGCGKLQRLNLKYQKGKSLTHACSYKELENLELVAVCDPSEIARDDFAKRWNIKNTFPNISL